MNLEYIQTFLAIVRTGNFREAARQLGISQPAVSQQIKKLEEWLNVQLIIRNRAGNQLTPEAKLFLPYAEGMVLLMERAIAAMQSAQLKIGASSNIGTYILPPYVKQYLQGQGGLCPVDLVIESNPAIAQKLEFGAIDLAVMEWWDNRPGFTAQLWRTEELVLIVPGDSDWNHLSNIQEIDLETVDMLGGEPGTGTGRLLRQYFGDRIAKMRISMQLGSTEAVKQAVRAGLGVSIVLAASVQQEVEAGMIRAIPINLNGKPLQKELFAIWRSSLSLHSAPYQFMQLLLDLKL